MPTRPKRACLERGCLAYAETIGRCAEHAAPILRERQRRDRADEPGRRFYHTTRWKALRAAILRAEPLCRACAAQGRPEPATEIDHVLRHRGSAALFWMQANLQPLCATCHIAKTIRERRDARRPGQ